MAVDTLFYSNPWFLIPMIPFGVMFYRQLIKQCVSKKQQEFEKQFLNALQSMDAELNIGYSMENTLKEVQKDMRAMYDDDTVIVREFTYMARQLNLNVPAEQVLKDFAARVQTKDVSSFVTVFVQAKRSGGNSNRIIRDAVKQLTDRAEVRREIATVIAAKRMEFNVMTAVPFGIIVYMRLSFSGFLDMLYGNVLGVTVMTVCLAAFYGAWKLGCKIVDIEV